MILKKKLRIANKKRQANPLNEPEGYWPLISEIDDLSFLEYCHERGLQCGLPFIINATCPLSFKAWQPSDLLDRGRYDIPSPSPHAVDLTPDILLVPLVAFDQNCYRLGK
eukprot:gene28651-37865_t